MRRPQFGLPRLSPVKIPPTPALALSPMHPNRQHPPAAQLQTLLNLQNAWNSNQIKHFRNFYQYGIRVPTANTSSYFPSSRHPFHKNHLTPDTRIDYKMPHKPVHVLMHISPIACDNAHGRCTVYNDTASYQS